jgi:phosphopantothenoylcysteine synthetase/decarboxylase
MGFAIAGFLAELGARVILICGPVSLQSNHPNIQRIDVLSADQMFEASLKHFSGCDGAVMTAAVADYAPVVVEQEKIKRQEGNLILELRPNRDIAAALGVLKRQDQVLVGFALESQNEVENALSKLKRKNMDLIVLNSLQDKGAGFGFDTNKISILTRNGEVFYYPLKSKQEVAKDIVACMLETAPFLSEC